MSTLGGVGDRSELTGLLADPGAYLDHPDPTIRRLAVAGAPPELLPTVARLAVDDPDPGVRREAVEALGTAPLELARPALAHARRDPDPGVVEATATAYGELGDPEAVAWLAEIAAEHPDRLVREAAVAALGAVGDPAGLPVLLRLVATGPPQVRRRCVVALTVFDGPEVDAAIHAAAEDRNPMVREVAEQLLGRR